jgi:DNA-binding transcriptional LysR family regulator
MLTRNMQYLVALAHERHFARAAARCGVSQPTLSAGIKHLEETLGVLIVARGQRFEGFTTEGQRILAWARRILADVDSLEQEVSALRGQLVGRLRIGAIPTALPTVDRLTTPFAQAHPSVTIAILSLSSVEIQHGLDDFTLDAGVTYLDNEPLANTRGIPLHEEEYFLVTPAKGAFADRTEVRWAEAATVPLCLLTPDMQNRRIINASFEKAGVTAKAAVESNSVLAITAHVRSGAWSSVLPRSFLSLFAEGDAVRAIPLVDPVVRHTIGLVVPDREPLTPSAHELVKMAESGGR